MILLLGLLWKSTACVLLTLLAGRLLERRSADVRAAAAQLGLLALLCVAFSVAALPARTIVLADPSGGAASRRLAKMVRAGFDAEAVEAIIVVGCLLVAGSLAGMLCLAVVRLQRLRRDAHVVQAPYWLRALSAAQARLGLRHGVALLVSHRLRSPLTWGVVRPVVIIDRQTLDDPKRADTVIAHELAHIARHDWLTLLAARLATALFWFNPLTWHLAARARALIEEAADDLVMRTGVAPVDYAALLVDLARRDGQPNGRLANPACPAPSGISRRVAHVLEHGTPRGTLSAGTRVLAGGCVAIASCALATVEIAFI